MTERTLPGIGLTGYWDQGAPWKVGGDRNWLLSSVLTQLSVESATTSLPASPLNGVIYIAPVGDPNANQVAARDNGAWVYFPPFEGLTAYVRDSNTAVRFDGAAWIPSTATTAAAGFGFSWSTLAAAMDRIDWGIQTAATGYNVLRKIPVAEWQAILNGTTTYDATAAVQAALDDVGASGGGKVSGVGTLVISNLVMKYDDTDFDGHRGCTIKQIGPISGFVPTTPNPHRPTVWIAADRCAVRGFTFTYVGWDSVNLASLLTPRTATDPLYGSQIAISFGNLYQSPGVPYVLWGATLRPFKDNVIEDNTILGSAVHGIAIFNSVNTRISRNNVREYKGTAIYGKTNINVKADFNYIETGGDDGVYMGRLSDAALLTNTPWTATDIRGASLVFNTVVKTGAKGVSCSGYYDIDLSHNIVLESYAHGVSCGQEIGIPGCIGGQVTGNIVEGAFGSFGTPANGYYHTANIIANSGGTWFALENSGAVGVDISLNKAWLSPKITDPSQIQATRGVGGLVNYQDVDITFNKLYGFVRNNVGAETATGTPTSNVKVFGNLFDSSAVNQPTRFVQVGVNATSIDVSQNVFKSGAAANASFAAVQLFAGARVTGARNTFALTNGLQKYRNDGAFMDMRDEVSDAVSTGTLTGTSIAPRLTWAAASPTTGLFSARDRVGNTAATAAGNATFWSAAASGGAYSTTRANSTAYVLNVWARWTTGATVWKCTTAGTSDVAAPSIVGKVVGDTVADGTAVWTLMSLTSATFLIEGVLA